MKELENHFEEFQNREAYTYSILNRNGDKCIGCLYIRPTEISLFSARVDFWFRDDSKKFEAEFSEWLKNWLMNEWGLTNCTFPGRSISWEDYYLGLDNLKGPKLPSF